MILSEDKLYEEIMSRIEKYISEGTQMGSTVNYIMKICSDFYNIPIGDAELYQKEYYQCIGIDNKIHECEPHEDKTYCGIKIKSKKLRIKDITDRYYCYECDNKN